MGFQVFFQTIGMTPAFAGRPFFAMFLLAMIGRGWSQQTGLGEPAWFFSETTLIITGLLALLEVGANYDETARLMLRDIDTYVKPGAHFIATFPIVDEQTLILLNQLSGVLPSDGMLGPFQLSALGAVGGLSGIFGQLGHLVAIIWSVVVAGTTWLMTSMWHNLLSILTDADEDDSIGLGGVVHWLETAWTGIWMVVFVFILGAAVAVIISLVALGALALIGFLFRMGEKRAIIPCHFCPATIHPHALICPQCRQSNPHPCRVGLFGQAKREIITDRNLHQLQLLSRKRCPACADRLKERTVQQMCITCGEAAFAHPQAVQHYLGWVGGRLPTTMLITAGLGFVPILGLGPALIYYRLALIAPLRGYVPRTVGCVTTWGMRLASLILSTLQVFGLGVFTVPLLCWLHFSVYRQVISGDMRRMTPLAPYPQPVAPPVPYGYSAASYGSGAGGPSMTPQLSSPQSSGLPPHQPSYQPPYRQGS